MTGSAKLPTWAVHLVSVLGAAVVFFAADKNFMAMLPQWIQTSAPPLVAFLSYAGFSQLQTKPAPASPVAP